MRQPDTAKLAEHYAAILREVGADLDSEGRDTHSVMKVNVMHGVFQSDSNVRNEFLMRLHRK